MFTDEKKGNAPVASAGLTGYRVLTAEGRVEFMVRRELAIAPEVFSVPIAILSAAYATALVEGLIAQGITPSLPVKMPLTDMGRKIAAGGHHA